MPIMTLHRSDGSDAEEIAYDGLILPPGYIKIMSGDTVRCIHESLVPMLTLHGLTPDQFESLE